MKGEIVLIIVMNMDKCLLSYKTGKKVKVTGLLKSALITALPNEHHVTIHDMKVIERENAPSHPE